MTVTDAAGPPPRSTGPLSLDWPDLRALLRASTVVTFSRGAVLCAEDGAGDCAFLIRRGRVEIFKSSRGRHRSLAVRGRNELVGEMALFERRCRTASARALDPVRARVLPAAIIWDLLEQHPRLALPVLGVISHRLRTVQQDLLDDLTEKVEQLEEANERLESRVAERTRELQASNQALEQAAVSDYLTGCYNRRWLMEHLARRCVPGHPVGVVLMDVDHFKHYNDHNGHLMGDELLCRFVRVIQARLRPGDTLARYGGEEFVLILDGADPGTACALADTVREAVAREPFAAAATQPLGKVSLTAGVATFPADGSDPQELLKQADVRLYLGKERGRNRVVACD